MADSDSDDASIEGRVSRLLFQDVDYYEEESDQSSEKDSENAKNIEEGEGTATISIMNVTIAHKNKIASIAEMLWPAAQYLAEYILEFVSKHHDQHDQHDQHQQPLHTNVTKQDALKKLDSLLQDSNFAILELGAGLGLTGIKLATAIPCSAVLLTDLDVALPLLQKNISLNLDKFLHPIAVQAQRLEWGNAHDSKSCHDTLESMIQRSEPAYQGKHKLLVLASDCVYFPHLHEPLETTIAQLLSQAPTGSICLIAGMRRWKHDTSFYSHVGKRSRTNTHQLVCTCIDEHVIPKEDKKISHGVQVSSRSIRRIYAIQWLPKTNRSNTPTLTSTFQQDKAVHYLIVFGKPGAGKSTLTEEVVRLYNNQKNKSNKVLLPLDLDICIPSWMKDNFSKGIYPTLEQRIVFSQTACEYVEEQCCNVRKNLEPRKSLIVIISFSFVNPDLRHVFRTKFPSATWILVHVSDSVASERILSRSDHFYKGSSDELSKNNLMQPSGSEWHFAYVDFDHIVLDGMQSIEFNGKKILDLL